jgi:hypothetical protein
MHSLNTFGARTSHGQTRTHKTQHGPNLGEATTFPLILYYVPLREAHIQMTFFLGFPNGSFEISKVKTPATLGPITLCADLWLRWGLKQSCNPCWELLNGMWYTTWTQGNRVDTRLLVLRSQIANLTPGLSFGHNLCFNYSNDSSKPILNIYVSIAFQWYTKLLNPLGLDPCDRPLKIQESTGTLTPNMRVHLGVWGFFPSHFFALSGAWNATRGLSLGPHSYKPLPWSRAQG